MYQGWEESEAGIWRLHPTKWHLVPHSAHWVLQYTLLHTAAHCTLLHTIVFASTTHLRCSLQCFAIMDILHPHIIFLPFFIHKWYFYHFSSTYNISTIFQCTSLCSADYTDLHRLDLSLLPALLCHYPSPGLCTLHFVERSQFSIQMWQCAI